MRAKFGTLSPTWQPKEDRHLRTQSMTSLTRLDIVVFMAALVLLEMELPPRYKLRKCASAPMAPLNAE